MERKIDILKRPIQQNQTGLLPNKFKKLGWVIVLLAILFALVVGAGVIPLEASIKVSMRHWLLNVLILGMLLIAWAKDTVEDELTILIRFRVLGSAFIWAVLLVIIKPFIDILLQDSISEMGAQQLVLSMLFYYLMVYNIQKRNR
jgi:hypothetical protein